MELYQTTNTKYGTAVLSVDLPYK